MTKNNSESQIPRKNKRRTQRSTPPPPPPPTPPAWWKRLIATVLRGTIGVLESTVEKLETPTPPGTESNSGFLSGIFRGIRSILPQSWSAKLSDTALGGIIALITVALVWTSSTLLTNKSPDVIATVPPTTPSSVEKTGEKTTEKAIPSSEEKIPPTSEEVPTSTKTPESEDLTEVTPTLPETEPEPKAEVTPTPTLETTPSPEPEVEVIPTPTPTTTPTLEAIPEATPEPTPEPVVELTPEQILIAAIQKQVGEISDKFISGLIKSIQANFSDSTLTLIISDDWYSFKESQQDKLASQILQQSKEFDFTHLEITDSGGSLIARNPVIGDEMVIFRR